MLASPGSITPGGTVDATCRPETVRKQFMDTHRLLGFQNLLCLLQFGTLPRDLTEKNIRLFAREVMPALQELTDKQYTGQEMHAAE